MFVVSMSAHFCSVPISIEELQSKFQRYSPPQRVSCHTHDTRFHVHPSSRVPATRFSRLLPPFAMRNHRSRVMIPYSPIGTITSYQFLVPAPMDADTSH